MEKQNIFENLPTLIIQYFSTDNAGTGERFIERPGNVRIPLTNRKTIKNFADEVFGTGAGLNINLTKRIYSICEKLRLEGYLVENGYGYDPDDPLSEKKYYFNKSYFTFNFLKDYKELIEYNSFNFLIHGFQLIRKHFSSNVMPVIVKMSDDKDTIGTCFSIGSDLIVTAKHCIENMKLVKILYNSKPIEVEKIYVSIKQDIAIIKTKENIFSNFFKIKNGEVLDEILTIGFPSLPGFEAIQFAEISKINSVIKSSTGSIVGADKSYLDKHNYFILNARVKGGNSGGPVINNLGYVVGMVVDIPLNPQNTNELNSLGYSIAHTGDDILEFINFINTGNTEMFDELKINKNPDLSFSTLQ